VDLHFGYRVLSDIALYLRHVSEQIGTSTGVHEAAVDIQILEHVLPRLVQMAHGQADTLAELLSFCVYGEVAAERPEPAALLSSLRVDSGDQAVREDGAPVLYPRSSGRLHRMLTSQLSG